MIVGVNMVVMKVLQSARREVPLGNPKPRRATWRMQASSVHSGNVANTALNIKAHKNIRSAILDGYRWIPWLKIPRIFLTWNRTIKHSPEDLQPVLRMQVWD